MVSGLHSLILSSLILIFIFLLLLSVFIIVHVLNRFDQIQI